MMRYVCVRQGRQSNTEGPFEVYVSVTKPRYAKRGHSFVTVYRQEEGAPKTCLFPGQEVPVIGQKAARFFLESLGWIVQSASSENRTRRCRVKHSANDPYLDLCGNFPEDEVSEDTEEAAL